MMKQFSYRHTKEAELMDSMEQAAKGAPQTDEELFSFAGFNEAEVERTGYSNYSYWSSTFRAFLKNKGAVVLLVLLLLLLAFTFIQPHLPGQYDPNMIVNDEAGMQYRNIPPGDQFILGTNSIGQDLWARIWAGTRTSLLIGLSVALAEALIGITVGVIWGYVRKADFILTEIYNIIDNIPNTIVLILISYILKPGVKTLIFAMCLTGWIQMARFIRNQILIIRDRDYNVASRCLGTPTAKIIIKNLLPYLVSVIMLRMALAAAFLFLHTADLLGKALAYIGLGLPVNIPSLGNLINEGRALITSPALRYQLVYPTIILSFVTISFYIIGNAFSDAADPKNHV